MRRNNLMGDVPQFGWDGRPTYLRWPAPDGDDGGDGGGGGSDSDTTEDPDDDAKSDDEELGTKGKAALERERTARKAAEKRAKAGDTAIARLAEIENESKSEVERERDARLAAEQKAADLELKDLRRDVADDAGLPKAWAQRLVGTTKEELEADAEVLKKTLPESKKSDDDKDKDTDGKPPKKVPGAPAAPSGDGKAQAAGLAAAVGEHYGTK